MWFGQILLVTEEAVDVTEIVEGCVVSLATKHSILFAVLEQNRDLGIFYTNFLIFCLPLWLTGNYCKVFAVSYLLGGILRFPSAFSHIFVF